MKRNYIILFVLIIGLVYFISSQARHRSFPDPSALRMTEKTTPTSNATPGDPTAYFTLATDRTYTSNGLTVIPIRISASFLVDYAGMGPYKTLAEAMATKAVMVTEKISGEDSGEVSDNATVNTLYIENMGTDTVFVMAGEMVQGGKQDRIIAQSFLLYPKSGTVDLAVFCVEHGRWETQPAMQGAFASEVQAFEFTVKESTAANSLRKVAVEEKEQSKVWDKVSDITVTNYCVSSTGTYNALDQDKDFIEKENKYKEYFGEIFKSNQDIAGVAVFSGDYFIGIDVFCSPDLFSKEWSTLLPAYITDAITTPGKGKSPDDKLVNEKFNEFLKLYSDNSQLALNQKCMNGNRVVHCAKF